MFTYNTYFFKKNKVCTVLDLQKDLDKTKKKIF